MRYVFIFVCIVSTVLSGCVRISREHPDITYYNLKVTRGEEPRGRDEGMSLKLRALEARQPYDSRRFVYHVQKNEVVRDYYNQFAAFPAVMLTAAVGDWLQDSPSVDFVSRERDMIDCDYELRGEIIELYGDFTDPADPRAVLVLRFTLLATADIPYAVVFSREYEASVRVERVSSTALLEGWKKGVRRILNDLEEDLPQTES